jgi:DNA-binding NarL/FixJ family response regulator
VNTGTYPAAPDPAGWRRRGDELAARVAEAVREVAEALDVDALLIVRPHEPAGAVVAALTWRCIGAVRRLEAEPVAPEDGRIARLVALLTDLRALAFDLHQRDVERRTRHMSDCATGLARLRDLTGSADLLEAVCAEIAGRCGFQRTVLSRVEDGMWKPWMAYFTEPAQFEAWFDAWVEQSIALDPPIPESQMIVNPKPAVVYDTATATVKREIVIDSAQSTSYVVSPVMRGAEVVGFVHADHSTRRRVDSIDRDLLWAFTEGFSHLYERAVLLERVRAQRDHIRGVLAAGARALDDSGAGRIVLGARAEAAPGPAPALTLAPPGVARVSLTGLTRPAGPASLTAREAEVLALMAGGASNAAIAERLLIGEVTVKSHVQRILRKLGAANRTQAVALALGLAHE